MRGNAMRADRKPPPPFRERAADEQKGKPFVLRVDHKLSRDGLLAVFAAHGRRYGCAEELTGADCGERLRIYLTLHGELDAIDEYDTAPEVVRKWAARALESYLEELRQRRPTVYERYVVAEGALMAEE